MRRRRRPQRDILEIDALTTRQCPSRQAAGGRNLVSALDELEVRYFAGFAEDIAGAPGVTARTVRRHREEARTLLFPAWK